MFNLSFYKGKRVLVTGHTGFKGTWLCYVLEKAGAELTGYSLCREKDVNFYNMTCLNDKMNSVQGDVTNFESLFETVKTSTPEIIIHMAAQPLVRESYLNPLETYSTNFVGTLNVLEAARLSDSVKTVLNVTTDKVYYNDERNRGFTEDDMLDGYDPYSNSKSCSELVTHAYSRSFLSEKGINVSTARAGNVIGGGDFSKDRIIPDCVKAVIKGEKIIVRNPNSTRPYQHVLEPVMAYLLIAGSNNPGWYNVGPNDEDCFKTGRLVDTFIKYWGKGAERVYSPDNGPHEAGFLKLDSSKLKNTLGWEPRWNLDTAIEKTVEWYKVWNENGSITDCMDRQITEYLKNE